MANRAPLFYRSPDQIADMLREGYFRTAFHETLLQLPTSTHFRDSHFGEILSAIFAEKVIGWRLIYSKLKLLTAENSNPYKMDLMFFDPNQSQPTFVTAARDNIEALPEDERQTVREALLPYAEPEILYAGFLVIDTNTKSDSETSMLATRRSSKTFDIDLVCVDDLSAVSESTYTILDNMRRYV